MKNERHTKVIPAVVVVGGLINDKGIQSELEGPHACGPGQQISPKGHGSWHTVQRTDGRDL